MNNFRHNLIEWLRNNIDFALLLAVFTETPRWAVAFMAVNEPLWVGIPLGVLLAFATSHAWRAYFETHNWGLFAFNVASILIAVAVIAPVLFAMTSAQAHEVNITHVLPPGMIWGWATLLALTTFIPLVQLAAVQGIRAGTVQPAPAPKRKPSAQLEPAIVQPSPANDAQYEPNEDAQIPVIDKKQRAIQMHKEGVPIAQIARDLEAHRNTVGGWVRNGHHAEAAQ